jgi:hypothetical protein
LQYTANIYQARKQRVVQKRKRGGRKPPLQLYVAINTVQRVQLARVRMRKGNRVWVNFNGTMYAGTVKEKQTNGGLLVSYNNYPGEDQHYEEGEWRKYVCSRSKWSTKTVLSCNTADTSAATAPQCVG